MTQSTGADWWRPAPALPAGPRTADAADQSSSLAFALVLAFIILLLLAPQAALPGLGRVRIALPIAALAALVHCWTRFAAGRPIIRHIREMGVIAVLLAWIIVTMPLSRWPAASLEILFGDYLKAVGIFWLLSNTIATRRQLRAVAWALSLAAVPLAATGLWNFVSGNLRPGGVAAGGRIAGWDAPWTADANTLAMVLNLILPLAVTLLLASRRPLVRGILTVLVALDVTAIIVTFSRGGFLTLAVTFMLSLRMLQRWGRWHWAVAALVLLFAAVPLLPPRYLDRLATIGNSAADETGSAQGRWVHLRNGLRYTVGHPLVGAGMGMNVLAHCERVGIPANNCGRVCTDHPVPPCEAVHNSYLQLAMDLGWPGLGLFLMLLAGCIRGAARVRDQCANRPAWRDLAALAEGIRIAIVAFAVAAFVYPWAYAPYFYLVAGLAAAAGAVYDAEARAAGMAALAPAPAR